MKVISSSCPDEALFKGLKLLQSEGERQDSRNGKVLVMPYPVMTVNEKPMQRVIFSPQRDANPVFHLNEALWMLAGRNDIKWLDQFVGNFSERFGEVDCTGRTYQHGAYGYRWRNHFDVDGGGDLDRIPDQLATAIMLLKKNPDERRVVIAMWDPVADLAQNKKDLPCNTHIYLRVRKEPDGTVDVGPASVPRYRLLLDLTVCCRSNDAVWGAHGANVVHFSILQEYLAAHIGVGIGKLYQLSNNYHAYLDTMPTMPFNEEPNRYASGKIGCKIVENVDDFEHDLKNYMSANWENLRYKTGFFLNVAYLMRYAYKCWRVGEHSKARQLVAHGSTCDWLIASREWFDRHMSRKQGVKLEGDQNVG